MTEREQALQIANMWLDFRMNSLTQMVPGDPDCDACVLARQYIRAIEALERANSPVVDCRNNHEGERFRPAECGGFQGHED